MHFGLQKYVLTKYSLSDVIRQKIKIFGYVETQEISPIKTFTTLLIL